MTNPDSTAPLEEEFATVRGALSFNLAPTHSDGYAALDRIQSEYHRLTAENERLRSCAAMLYGAQALLRMDTPEDESLRLRMLELARALFPGIESEEAELAKRGEGSRAARNTEGEG